MYRTSGGTKTKNWDNHWMIHLSPAPVELALEPPHRPRAVCLHPLHTIISPSHPPIPTSTVPGLLHRDAAIWPRTCVATAHAHTMPQCDTRAHMHMSANQSTQRPPSTQQCQTRRRVWLCVERHATVGPNVWWEGMRPAQRAWCPYNVSRPRA